MTRELTSRPCLDDTVELAARLVEIEGHEDLPHHERPVAEWLAGHLEDRLRSDRSDVRLQEVPGDRRNVVATVRGRKPGPTLMLNAHLDTVPGYGMPDCYRPSVRDGRLYGRGAVDMKGALASMVACLEVFAAEDVDFAGELVLTAVAGEENGSAGMLELTRQGVRADFAVVGEPTGMRIARAHKGAMWLEAVFSGVATHGSVPDEGVNAVYHAARFTQLVEQELVPRLRRRTHPLLGSATVNVGVIAGGDRPPMVPAECRVQLDRRWLPQENHEEVVAEVAELIERLRLDDPRVDGAVAEMAGTSAFVHAPLDCPPTAAGLQHLMRSVATHADNGAEPIGVNFWTDGALLASGAGAPTVVCGPGDIAQAHSLDEWVAVDQLGQAAKTYVALAAGMLAAETVPEPPAHGEDGAR